MFSFLTFSKDFSLLTKLCAANSLCMVMRESDEETLLAISKCFDDNWSELIAQRTSLPAPLQVFHEAFKKAKSKNPKLS